jgi:hypothetical protein
MYDGGLSNFFHECRSPLGQRCVSDMLIYPPFPSPSPFPLPLPLSPAAMRPTSESQHLGPVAAHPAFASASPSGAAAGGPPAGHVPVFEVPVCGGGGGGGGEVDAALDALFEANSDARSNIISQ